MTSYFPDTDAILDATSRAVTAAPGPGTTRTTTVTLSRTYPTTLEDLWSACTTPERLARWFAPVHGDLELGGRYQVEGNAGGTIEACDPPRSFRLSWEMGPATAYVDVTLEPDGDDRSRMTLVHSGDVEAEFWDKFGPGAVGVGWDLAFGGMGHYLETDADLVLEASAWGTSDEAKQFMTDSARRWADAAIAAGAPEEEARAQQAATTGFYTGVPEEGGEG